MKWTFWQCDNDLITVFITVSQSIQKAQKSKIYLLPPHSTAMPAKMCKPLCAISEVLLWEAPLLSLPYAWAKSSPGYKPKPESENGR